MDVQYAHAVLSASFLVFVCMRHDERALIGARITLLELLCSITGKEGGESTGEGRSRHNAQSGDEDNFKLTIKNNCA